MVNVAKELEVLRQNLLDLSLRNNLLNYRPSKKRTVLITDRMPEEIYELAVLQERALKFRAKIKSRKSRKTENEEAKIETKAETIENESSFLKTISRVFGHQDDNNQSDNSNNIDTNDNNENNSSIDKPLTFSPASLNYILETPDDNETLERKLFYVFNQANSIFEEQGYPVLYLAIGFLQWSENKSSVKNPKAPLILIPVELKRTGKGRNFSLQWTGDEVFTSITLQAKMKELGVQLPEFEMPEDSAGIGDYFKAVTTAIEEKTGWQVLPEICLDLFNFRKFVMYKDLDPATWPEDASPAEQLLIQKIFNPQEPEPLDSGFREEEVDLKLTAKDTYHIMDADSSQIAVIEDIKAGKNLVVEGPPGTGKSQTIANTIAELIAQGRSVLFVSEKMAALQVVKSRLDAAGLGELCLEIHSNKTRKKAVLEELEKTLSRAVPDPTSPERELSELEKLKQELNTYISSLGNPVGKIYPSLYTLYGIREKTKAYFEDRGPKMPTYSFKDPQTWDSKAWAEAESALEKIGQVLPSLGPARKNPWYGCEPGLVLPSDLQEIEVFSGECAAAFENLENAVKTLNELSGTSKPQTLEGIKSTIEAVKLLGTSKPLPEKMLQNSEWDSEASKIEAEVLISKLRKYIELKNFVDKNFEPSVFKLDTSEFEELSCKFLKVVSPKYRRLKKEISACYISGVPSQDKKILLDLACISEFEAYRLEIEKTGKEGKKYFLEAWKGFESDPAFLEEYLKWIIPFRKYVRENVFAEKIFGLVIGGTDREALKNTINEVSAAKEAFLEALEKVRACIKADFEKMFGKPLEGVKLSQLKSHITKWKNETSSLVFWSQYLGYRQVCIETKAAPMIEDIEAGKIETCDIIPAFEGNYAELLLHRAIREKPALSSFIRELHEGRITKFTELDKKVLLENRKRIICSAYEEAPKLNAGASRASEAGILLNEFNRKRGHMPIRALMKKAGGLVQKIKPCFLMSPLSIAQYLDPRSTRFDVIIFDEASQVRPEDAVGALLRGKQVVVMGDSKQLPPTDFFDSVVDFPETEPDDFASAGDMESILNVCKRSFPVKTLRWHYRSRHESLIAVSNQEFYDNRLYVYPSPMQKDEKLGLKFVHLQDAVYDRGKSGVNRVEARAVAKAVFEHFSKSPEKSLGVGTFNIKQQEAIQEEIEALLKANPGFDLNLGNERGEHFFVKNLETIQGDERDVILLSVGFGFDSNKKLSLNFGPLNREGGERRLNVLITRAREKCVVFANFTSNDLNLEENSPFGLRSLKVFMEFAEKGRLASCAGKEAFDSPFEEVVSAFLAENNFEVHRQIGCAGYRLDLAIPDPGSPGKYILGIECDGARYHSLQVARDRDRLRQQVLEGLGWKIYRVWSTDWYLRPKESKERLLEAVKNAVKQAKSQAKVEKNPEIPKIKEPAAWAEETNNKNLEKPPIDEKGMSNNSIPNSSLNSSIDYSTNFSIDSSINPVSSAEENSDKDSGKAQVLSPKHSTTLSRNSGLPSGNLLPENAAKRTFKATKKSEEDPGEAVYYSEKTTGFSDEVNFEVETEEVSSGEFFKLGEGISAGLNSAEFLPEMALKAQSMALLASENSRKKPVRRQKSSKLLKFSADPSSEESSYEPVPEPEPEKFTFFQAYPEIDFSAGIQKKKRRRINEFAYIYGSGKYSEPELDFEDKDDYTETVWNSESESSSEAEANSDFDFGNEPENKTYSETYSESISTTKKRVTGEPAKESDSKTYSGLLSEGFGRTDRTSSIERKESERVSEKIGSLEAAVPSYKICAALELPQSTDLSEISDRQLEKAVIKIVECEGPIHPELLLQRIKLQTGIPRMIGKIRQRVSDLLMLIEDSGKIRKEGEFYWPASKNVCLLRRRDETASVKIEWICDEEIKEAVRFVLKNQYSTPLEALIVQTSRVLGIKTTRKNTSERIEKLVQESIENNELTFTPNEMIYFAE